MESLYVCLFSNGHIKVGRSLDPAARIAQHADRVACMGVELADYYTSATAGETERREAMLIDLCAAAPGATRFKSEWFAGLEFDHVRSWAEHCAFRPLGPMPETPWMKTIASLRAVGWTHAELAKECNCGAATISRLALGQQQEPMHSMGETLLRIAQQSLPKPL